MTSTKNKAVSVAACLLLLAACGEPAAPNDAGALDASQDGSSAQLCARDRDCDDGLFCTTDRCRPGEEGADGSGCVDLGSPCQAGETCNESADRCDRADCSNPDVDLDGHNAVACGGDDCDDADSDLYPGNPEVCDEVDQDCVPDTFAGPDDGDMDGDGEVAATCCNGEECGRDCNDGEASINSSARETCNGIDDDCSGTTDDETGPVALCPGGLCQAGRCSFTSWDRVLGFGGNDSADAVVTDAAGNVYVTGYFTAGTDFGAGPVDGALVVSYSADGTLRWVLTPEEAPAFEGGASGFGYDVSADAIYMVGRRSLARLNTDGTVAWVVRQPGSWNASVDAASGRVVVAGAFIGSFDFDAATTRTAVGLRDCYIASYDPAGNLSWVQTHGGAGAYCEWTSVSIDSAGNGYVVGDFSGAAIDFGDGAQNPNGGAGIVVASVHGDGTAGWSHVFDSPGYDQAAALDVGGALLFASGVMQESVSFGGGSVDPGGFVLALALDGSYQWERVFGHPPAAEGSAKPNEVVADDDDRVWVVGEFTGAVDVGAGGFLLNDSGPAGDIFMVRYRSDRLHLASRTYGEGGLQSARSISVGPGGAITIAGVFYGSVTFDSGTTRTVAGGQSGFVARLVD